jgi:hypothetical protein
MYVFVSAEYFLMTECLLCVYQENILHEILGKLAFPVDDYSLHQCCPTQALPLPGGNQQWPVYVQNSTIPHGSRNSTPSLGHPVGYLYTNSGNQLMLRLLPYNFPKLFTLLVRGVHLMETKQKELAGKMSTTTIQPSLMTPAWRQEFQAYLMEVPACYLALLRGALKKYSLHTIIPEVPDSGRSHQVLWWTLCVGISLTDSLCLGFALLETLAGTDQGCE